MKLNPKQKAFVAEYLVDLNATQAAIRAGYSAKTADVQGARLLGYVSVQAAIQAGQQARSRRLDVSQDRVVLELARIAFADVEQYARWDDKGMGLLPSEKLTRDQTAAIQEVTHTERSDGGFQVKFKLHDKLGALQLLGKHLGMFVDRTKIEGELQITTLADLARSVAARRAQQPREVAAAMIAAARPSGPGPLPKNGTNGTNGKSNGTNGRASDSHS